MPSNEQRRDNAKRKLERQLVRRAERARRRKTVAAVGTVVGVVVVAGAIFLFGFSGVFSDDQVAEPAADQQQSSAAQGEVDKPQDIPAKPIALPARPKALPATVNCKYPKSPEPAAKPAKAPSGSGISARGEVEDKLRTTAGELTLTLDRSLAPCAVNSFVNLTEQGYFDNTPCHRLTVSGLQVLQCGDPSGSGSGGPGYSFADETFPQIKYGRGVLAMANSGPDTNGSQFFIVYGNAELPPDYTVFGSIDAEGLKRVDDLAKIGTVRGTDPASGQPTPGDGKPKKEMRIQQASIAG